MYEKIGLIDMYRALRLSQNSFGSGGCNSRMHRSMHRSFRMNDIHVNLAVVLVIALYSTSKLDLAMIGFFLEVHKMQFDQRKK